jgi:PAS domain S-box-containing protein
MKIQLAGAPHTVARYGGAVLAVVLATVARMLVIPIIGLEFPFHVYWIVVPFVAYWGGRGPGVLAALLGAAATRFFFLTPLYSFSFSDRNYVFRSAIFLVYCGLMIIGATALRTALDRAKQARVQAEEAEQRANRILDSIGDGFAVVDTKCRIIRVNPRAVEITRNTLGKILGSSLWDVFSELKPGRMEAALRQAIDQKRQAHFEDYHPGTDLWLEGDAYPCEQGVTIFFRDITGRKKAELAIAAHTQELQRKSNDLLRSNGELQQFAYAAAHDLQEPLRTIAALSRTLANDHVRHLEPEARECIDSIDRSADRMRKMIADLLTYSWAVSNPEQAHEHLDSQVLVEMAIMNCQSAINESQTLVEIGDLPGVRGTAQQLVLVFQNLISNSIKYRSAEPPHIRIDAQAAGREWVFTFEDNGIGLDMKFADRIFGVFKRLHGPEIPGTGIGLALCKRVVDNHGGHIWVESEPGNGAKFKFTLPAG